MAWLLDGGVQVKTSGVSDSWYRAFMYFNASIVCLELTVPFLDLLVDLGHIDGLLLIGRRGREQHHEVVPPAGRSLRGGLRGEVDEINVVNSDVGVVLLPPLLAKGPVKPRVVGGNEVAPLENLQSLLLGRSAVREQEERPGRSAER